MTEPILGVVLAGGLARRMGGGDKPLRRLGGRTLLDRVLARLAPQCDQLLINANGDGGRFAATGLTVIADKVAGFAGPLAGIMAALDWAACNRPEIRYVVSAPADSPFIPYDFVARLVTARAAADMPLACAETGGRTHPVAGLWSVALRDDLRHALVIESLRKIESWTARHGVARADWPLVPINPFYNVNTPEDLDEAERLIGAHGDV